VHTHSFFCCRIYIYCIWNHTPINKHCLEDTVIYDSSVLILEENNLVFVEFILYIILIIDNCVSSTKTNFISSKFDVPVTVHHVKFLIIKCRCANFLNLFLQWKVTCFGQFLWPSSGVLHCTHSNGICHTGLLTACKQDQDGTVSDPASKLWANLYDIYHCCVYCEKLLMMGRGIVWNMQSFIPRINLRN
jgi:hypothetical protein